VIAARATSRTLPTLALFAGAVAIATAPVFVRLAETGPLTTAFWRVLLSLPFAWAWWIASAQARHSAPAGRRSPLPVLLAGLFFAGDLGIWHLSIMLTPVANATLLVNTAPLFVTLGAWLLFGQRTRPLFWLGMALALAGSTLLVRSSLAAEPRQLLGDALAVVAAVCYAGYLLAVSRARLVWPTASLMAIGATVTSLALLPAVLLSGEIVWPASGRGWLTLGLLTLIAQLFGQGLITYALAHLPASFSSVGLLVQPVMAAVFAWLLLGEGLGWAQAGGGAVVLAGIWLARRASP
jgi:drug/metabolite transporter (DMT)-like permease